MACHSTSSLLNSRYNASRSATDATNRGKLSPGDAATRAAISRTRVFRRLSPRSTPANSSSISARPSTRPEASLGAIGRQGVTGRLVAVQRLLRAAGAVVTLRLVVRRGARVERWTGVKRRRRPVIWVPEVEAFVDGVPTLADDDGRPVVALDGLAMIDTPAAGEPEELFVLAGGDGDGTIFAAAAGYQRRVAGAPLGLATAAGAPDEIDERGPYPGLAPFATADAAWFVGREREIRGVRQPVARSAAGGGGGAVGRGQELVRARRRGAGQRRRRGGGVPAR